jgi:hypothetical protein
VTFTGIGFVLLNSETLPDEELDEVVREAPVMLS